MARGRRKAEWGRTSELLAMLWNVNVEPDKRKQPSFFNPYAPPEPSRPEERPGYVGKMTMREIYMGMFGGRSIAAPKRKPDPDD
jgi:hypothetical protein